MIRMFCLNLFFWFVWFFFEGGHPNWDFFPPAITGEGLQNAIYSRLLWPMSIEGSLACHAIFDTGHPFIIDISSLGTCDTCSRVWQWKCHYICFCDRESNTDLSHPRQTLYLSYCCLGRVFMWYGLVILWKCIWFLDYINVLSTLV